MDSNTGSWNVERASEIEAAEGLKLKVLAHIEASSFTTYEVADKLDITERSWHRLKLRKWGLLTAWRIAETFGVAFAIDIDNDVATPLVFEASNG